jgi:hypothetical protein
MTERELNHWMAYIEVMKPEPFGAWERWAAEQASYDDTKSISDFLPLAMRKTRTR